MQNTSHNACSGSRYGCCGNGITTKTDASGANCRIGSHGSSSSSDSDKYELIQERNVQTLTDIQNLQDIEKDMFSKLEQGTADKSLTQEQKDTLVQKINEISQIRINLYQNLNGTFSFFKDNVSSVHDTLVEQSGAIEIVENELNEAKMRLKSLETEKNNKLRLVEINTYYGDQYADHTSIMKYIILICIPIIILTIFYNKDIISKNVYSVLVVIIVVISAYYMWPKIVRLNSHDNMNYDEYNWNFNPADPNLPDPVNTSPTSIQLSDPWASGTETCVGQACCFGDNVYNSTTNQCEPLGYVAPTSSSSTAGTSSITGLNASESGIGQNSYLPDVGGFGGL